MNNWDKVEKRKKQVTQSDINWIYFKTACFVFVSILYLYFVVLGYTISDIL